MGCGFIGWVGFMTIWFLGAGLLIGLIHVVVWAWQAHKMWLHYDSDEDCATASDLRYLRIEVDYHESYRKIHGEAIQKLREQVEALSVKGKK